MRIIIISLLVFVSSTSFSQVSVYMTQSDYLNGNSIEYSKVYEAIRKKNNGQISFKGLDGKKVKLLCSEFYGFTYKKTLFRTVEVYGVHEFGALDTEGKICFWMNGDIRLNQLREVENSFTSPEGGMYYVSQSKTSEIKSAYDPKSTELYERNDLLEIKNCIWKNEEQMEPRQDIKGSINCIQNLIKE